MTMDGKVISLSDVSIVLSPKPLHYQKQNKVAIEAHWAIAQAKKPTLFNGSSYLASSLHYDGGRLLGEYHRTDYKTLLYWRADKSLDKPWHIFASAVIVSRDNGLLIGQMAQDTALAGFCYFPSGSIDDDDIMEGRANYRSNMEREVLEETGVHLESLTTDGRFYMSTHHHSVALFQLFHTSLLGEELEKQVCNYLKNQDNPELESISILYKAADLRQSFPYIQAFADWYFRH